MTLSLSVLESPSRLDEEHRLIARYAARLAAEAGNSTVREPSYVHQTWRARRAGVRLLYSGCDHDYSVVMLLCSGCDHDYSSGHCSFIQGVILSLKPYVLNPRRGSLSLLLSPFCF